MVQMSKAIYVILFGFAAGFAYDSGVFGSLDGFLRLLAAERYSENPLVAPIKEIVEPTFPWSGKNVVNCLCEDQTVFVIKILSLSAIVVVG